MGGLLNPLVMYENKLDIKDLNLIIEPGIYSTGELSTYINLPDFKRAHVRGIIIVSGYDTSNGRRLIQCIITQQAEVACRFALDKNNWDNWTING